MQLSAESLKGLGGPGAALLSYSVKLPPAAGGPPPGSAGGGGGSPPGGAGPPGPGAVSTPGGPGPLSAAGPPAPAPAGPALLAAAHGHPALVAAAAAAHYHPSVAQSMTQVSHSKYPHNFVSEKVPENEHNFSECQAKNSKAHSV